MYEVLGIKVLQHHNAVEAAVQHLCRAVPAVFKFIILFFTLVGALHGSLSVIFLFPWQEVWEFGAATRELLLLADWLLQGDCQMAAMEVPVPIGSRSIMFWKLPAWRPWWSMPTI